MNRREKEEIDRLRYELTMNTKLVEHLQKATIKFKVSYPVDDAICYAQAYK
jgi:hypothetical protein